MTKSVMTRWILILWSKAKAGTSSQALATFVARSATRPQSVGQETERQTKVRVDIRVRMWHLREKEASLSGKVQKELKGHPKGQGKSKSKGKGKWKSKGRKGFQSGSSADSLEFEEEPWDETNQTEPEKWWNSWTDGAEPKRDGAPLGAFMVGGTELELNSFKTASGEILPDEGQLMWPCFLQDGRKCWLRGACHGCSQASEISRQGAGQRQSGHLAFQWRLDPLLELSHQNLDFKSNDEGSKASTDGRAHQVV